MPYLILVLCLVVGFYLMGRWFIAADPRQIVRGLRVLAIILGVVLLLVLAVTGRLTFLIGFLPLALPFLRRWQTRRGWSRPGRRPSAGQVSELETANLSVRLDHDTGQVSGRVRTGRFATQSLDALTMAELAGLHAEWQGSDGQSASVLEAYLDRRFGPEWRQPAPGGGPRRETASSTGPMSVAEAYSVLGLSEGASREEITAAHRRLMKQFHPDHGGTDYLAAKLNEAKDVLLGT